MYASGKVLRKKDYDRQAVISCFNVYFFQVPLSTKANKINSFFGSQVRVGGSGHGLVVG